MSKLMKPLFIGGNFNKDNKKIRVNYLKTVGEYPLWVEDGKPNKDYTTNPLDKYYIYIQIGEYIFTYGETEYNLIDRVGYNKVVEELYGDKTNRDAYFNEIYKGRTYEEYKPLVKKQTDIETELINVYGKNDDLQAEYLKNNINGNIKRWINARDNEGTFADFIGALVMNELDKCQEVAKNLRVKKEEEYKTKHKEIELKRKEEEKRKLQEEKILKDEVKNILINGGTIENANIIIKLADEYNIDIPIRTRGWILNNLAKVNITENGGVSYSYWRKSKNAKGSQKVYDVIFELKKQIA